MKKSIVLLLIVSVVFIVVSCGEANTHSGTPVPSGENDNAVAGAPYDPHRGEGRFTKVNVGATLDAAMAAKGEIVYNVKCIGCHKLNDEKLVGPGWKGVTSRHTAEWIMNFITNTEDMLKKDPKAQAQLAICLVRMPNQSLSDADARSVYEFQRKNDGVK